MKQKYWIFQYLFLFVFCVVYLIDLAAATPTFTLDFEPANPTEWATEWRPGYKTNASFVATLKGTTSSNQDVTFGSVTFTFTLSSVSRWKGVCMNYNGDPDTGTSYDLYFRKKDNPSGSGYTYTVEKIDTKTNAETVPGEVDENNNPLTTGLKLNVTGTGISSVIVSVRANDYAAVGILSASATFNYEDPRSGSTSSELICIKPKILFDIPERRFNLTSNGNTDIRVCKVLVTVRRGWVSPPEQRLHIGEETLPLRCLQFPNVKQTLIETGRTSFIIKVSTNTSHIPI